MAICYVYGWIRCLSKGLASVGAMIKCFEVGIVVVPGPM